LSDSSGAVNHPLKKTFDLHNNPDNMEKWMTGFISMTTLKETPEVVVSEFEFVFESQGQEATIHETVIHYEENTLLEFEFRTGEMFKKDIITFEAIDQDTRITNSSAIRGTDYLHRCMFAILKVFSDPSTRIIWMHSGDSQIRDEDNMPESAMKKICFTA
jgi:hypothetical protein